MVSFVLLAVSALLLVSVATCQNFCAKVYIGQNNSMAGNSSGYFWMSLFEGTGLYHFDVNLNSVRNCDFSMYPNVAYHIHTNLVNDSTKTPARSCSNAGYHYDPNLACGKDSAARETYCPALNRTHDQGYNYTCSSGLQVSTYLLPNGQCEVGDLSGKFGKIVFGADRVARSVANLTDALPPYVMNFRLPTPNFSAPWVSIVFHCGDPDATKIACGDFEVACGIKSYGSRHRRMLRDFPENCPYSC
jgi:hypothetical protein